MNYMEFRETDQKLMIKERTTEMMAIKNGLFELFEVSPDSEEIVMLPADDPLGGTRGYILWKTKNDKEISANIMIRVTRPVDEPSGITYKSREEFDKAFSEAWESGKPLYLCDDPVRRLCGFVIESRDSRVWHHITLTALKG